MAEYLLGIDIGTSSVKVAAFDRNGRAKASASADYPLYRPCPGWAEQDADDWYRGVCEALANLWGLGLVSPKDIEAIGLDGQGWSSVPVDDSGNTLFRTPSWLDTRAQTECAIINAKVGSDNIFRISGNSVSPSYTTPKVLWLKNNYPDIYAKTSKILHSNGYIGYRLTGNITDDLSSAYGWHCFNMREGKWDFDVARDMGINTSLLPELVNCDTIIGKVTENAAKETGLIAGTPVVAGGLDAACGTLGVGVIEDGETQEQGGQAGGMSICTDSCVAHEKLILSYHVVPGKWLLQGGTTGGGGVMKWFSEEFCGEERMNSDISGISVFQHLNAAAEKINPGSDGLVFLPYMNGERSPIWNPKAKGVFFGLDFTKTKAHVVRSCMEGVGFSLRHNLETAEAAGAPVSILRAMGGAANSQLWTQIKADITGKEIIVPSSDTATTLGAAMLAGVATGFYKDYREAVSFTVNISRNHIPNGKLKPVYDKNYELYLQIYEKLKELMV